MVKRAAILRRPSSKYYFCDVIQALQIFLIFLNVNFLIQQVRILVAISPVWYQTEAVNIKCQ